MADVGPAHVVQHAGLAVKEDVLDTNSVMLHRFLEVALGAVSLVHVALLVHLRYGPEVMAVACKSAVLDHHSQSVLKRLG